MSKLSECDVCTKLITPALLAAGWDLHTQIREEGKVKKRILFLADRNILVDQTPSNDFEPFGPAMTKIEKRQANKAYEIYLSLYQTVTASEEEKNIYKQLSRELFDFIVIDECHRDSPAEDSAWRGILEHFSSATQIGLTATPKETREVSNIHYFGEPVYSHSLKQGIADGFLAPYKALCDRMKADLAEARALQSRLTDAPIDSALETT